MIRLLLSLIVLANAAIVAALAIGTSSPRGVVFYQSRCEQGFANNCSSVYDIRHRLSHFWSRSQPDGSWIPDLSLHTFQDSRSFDNDIYIYQPHVNREAAISNDNIADFVPTGAPDGTAVAHMLETSTGSKVHLVSLTDTADRDYPIAGQPVDNSRGYWSHHSEYMVVITDGDDGALYTLWLVDIRGESVHRLSDSSRNYLSWASDDSKLLISSNELDSLQIVPITGDRTPISLTTWGSPRYFTWLADNTRIAYVIYERDDSQLFVHDPEKRSRYTGANLPDHWHHQLSLV